MTDATSPPPTQSSSTSSEPHDPSSPANDRRTPGGMRSAIDHVDVRVYRLATEGGPHSDGTATWDSTTMVIVEIRAESVTGLGYSYIAAPAARVIRDLLAPAILGLNPFATPAAVTAMLRVSRNHGRSGLIACAISAVDIALWDLRARLLGVSVATLLGYARESVPVYASGGFTSSNFDELAHELAGYAEEGHRRVKIKIGRDPDSDGERVRIARAALGPGIELMVDANGAYSRKQALGLAEQFARHNVVYFGAPVSFDDLEGLRLLRDRAPAGMAIAAGENGYNAGDFRRILDAGAVDIVQADATRALGISGFLSANALCASHAMPLSAHCAPAIHVHAGAAAGQLVHLEQFRDHARMEALLFEGTPIVAAGSVTAAFDRPGLGLTLQPREADRLAI